MGPASIEIIGVAVAKGRREIMGRIMTDIPYHVKIGPYIIDKIPPIKSAEFDSRAQKYTAFAYGP